MNRDEQRRARPALRTLAGLTVLVGLAGCATPMDVPDGFLVVERSVVIEAPPAVAWATLGDFCSIKTWLDVPCEIVRGHGERGTVRRIGEGVEERVTAVSPMAYTYEQTSGPLADLGYRATLRAEPGLRTGTTIVVWRGFFDPEAAPAAERKRAALDGLSSVFERGVTRMKRLVEQGV